uniref:Serine/threonine-protein phosphatase 2A regulatory subunit B'' subunit gamma n=2 Tax=Lutzomyia longipalpis TaxID=7200 RepID=A0A1B0GKZ4_LUTLO
MKFRDFILERAKKLDERTNITSNGARKLPEGGENTEISKNTSCHENVEKQGGNYRVIPKFYHPTPRPVESLMYKLREHVRTLFLKKQSEMLLNNADLKTFWMILENQFSRRTHNGELYITFSDYINLSSTLKPVYRRMLTVMAFARLQSISSLPGKISVISLFNYVMRKVWIQQTRISLSLYDHNGLGYLRESDLESYILELIPTLLQLKGLEKTFYSFYVCTAVRKFFFFLDPARTGKIRVRDILSHSFLDELMELRDDESPKDSQELNWFSAPSALSVYGHYLNLDKDHNGMLSKAELMGYGSGTLTSVFLDRLFSECLTYEGEMDYKTYLDFVLAMENRTEIQSQQYIFRLLDLHQRGFLTPSDLKFFFKGIEEQMAAHCVETVHFDDLKDEIYDMVNPKNPTQITFADIARCGQGPTMMSILIEFHKFWSYENREAKSELPDDKYLQ